jgi:hypothetical protein
VILVLPPASSIRLLAILCKVCVSGFHPETPFLYKRTYELAPCYHVEPDYKMVVLTEKTLVPDSANHMNVFFDKALIIVE